MNYDLTFRGNRVCSIGAHPDDIELQMRRPDRTHCQAD